MQPKWGRLLNSVIKAMRRDRGKRTMIFRCGNCSSSPIESVVEVVAGRRASARVSAASAIGSKAEVDATSA